MSPKNDRQKSVNMKNRLTFRLAKWQVSLMLIMVCVLSCKPSVDRDYIQPDDMEDILYEYHLAEEIVRQNGGDTLTMRSFRANILKKYGVTQMELDSSLLYYSRHTKLLHDIYKNLAERFTNEAAAQGASVSEISKFGNLSSSNDTTDIWNRRRMLVLYPQEASNVYMYKIKADTAFYKGDKIILDFDTRFIYQDGMRNAVAVLPLKFNNDSVASRTINITSTSRYHLQIEDTGNLGIKEITGYFLVNDNDRAASSSTTLRLLVLYNIRMVRMHQPKLPPVQKNDTVRVGKVDSVPVVRTGSHSESQVKSVPPKRFERTVVRPLDEKMLPAEMTKRK